MSFRWADYVEFAKELFSGGGAFSSFEEARLRTVISRSYYGVFKTAYTIYFSRVNPHMPKPSHGEHEWLIERYKNKRSPNDKYRKIASELERLKEYRVRADYRDDLEENPKRLARKALRHAEKALELLNSI